MGEAKLKQYNRQQFLLRHPWCIYCGAKATTTDHCPPRSLFVERKWPETYEFPACGPCNAEARRDEQALAALARIRLTNSDREPGRSELLKLMTGVRNNQPELVAEWLSLSRNEQKRSLRAMFGEAADRARREGWGAIHLGPLSRAAIERFMIKLGKALYYKHVGNLLDGFVAVQYVDILSSKNNPTLMRTIMELAPELASPQRAGKTLTDQFIYRYNYSPDHGVIHAVVQFSEQFIYYVAALSREMHEGLAKWQTEGGEPLLLEQRLVPVPLKHRPVEKSDGSTA